ncbi:MAG: class I SAM-dependent methyltransferase [Acidimicrobiales bacterium]
MSPAEPSHYFSERPELRSAPRPLDLVLPDLSLRLTTDRGVFAGRRVDPGTKLLLLEAPHPVDRPSDLLDLGCGYGPVALTIAARAPNATVWAVDVNERARALCAANAEANDLANVRVAVPGDVPDDVVFAGMWSNPPVRVGKADLHALLQTWLARLADGGRAWLVVHKQLGADSLARWLVAEGHPVERLTSRAGYRVMEVS